MKPQRFHPTLLSFDVLRIVAMSLVALHHLFCVPNKDGPSLFGALDFGQLGVACFCAVSGYFSLQSGSKGTVEWLTRRLQRVFVPYWISLIAIFAANAFTHYKPVSVSLVISEFMGTGLFTHRYSLIGVHVWFISLILMCYALALILRWNRRCFPVLFISSFAFVGWDPLVSAHLISFLGGCLLSEKTDAARRWAALGISTVCLVAIFFLNILYAYPMISTCLVLFAASFTTMSSRLISVMSNATYEFFLVHGPIYLGLAMYAGLGLFANLIAGTILAVLAAALLRKIDNTIFVLGAKINKLMNGWNANHPRLDSVD
jgi:peptidoglycan/LPS O-acetylase OafA/YrhL